MFAVIKPVISENVGVFGLIALIFLGKKSSID